MIQSTISISHISTYVLCFAWSIRFLRHHINDAKIRFTVSIYIIITLYAFVSYIQLDTIPQNPPKEILGIDMRELIITRQDVSRDLYKLSEEYTTILETIMTLILLFGAVFATHCGRERIGTSPYTGIILNYDDTWNRTLLRITPACLLTGLIAAALGQWYTAVGEVAVFVTSQLHWRDPQPGSRVRQLDLTVVTVSLAVHLQAIWAAEACAAFVAMAVAVVCFGWSLYSNSYPHHAAGWITSCISNLLLAHARYRLLYNV
jgi:hypothetical protein